MCTSQFYAAFYKDLCLLLLSWCTSNKWYPDHCTPKVTSLIFNTSKRKSISCVKKQQHHRKSYTFISASDYYLIIRWNNNAVLFYNTGWTQKHKKNLEIIKCYLYDVFMGFCIATCSIYWRISNNKLPGNQERFDLTMSLITQREELSIPESSSPLDADYFSVVSGITKRPTTIIHSEYRMKWMEF